MKRVLPAYPLFVKDPNFSIWSSSDILNEKNTECWFAAEKKIYGFVKTAGKTYCFMGNAADFANYGVEKAEQTEISVSAFATEYTFVLGAATLKVRFVSPLPPDDPMLCSMPVTYMEYELTGADDAEISLFANRRIAYNDLSDNANKAMRVCVVPLGKTEAAGMGLRRQLPLSNTGDFVGADWGYFYLAGERAYNADEKDLVAYLVGGCKDFSNGGEEKYIAAINTEKQSAIYFAYDDLVSIDYYGDHLKGLYLSKHTIFEALVYARDNRAEINAQLTAFDEKMRAQAASYGEAYYHILVASLRQSVAAHKLVEDKEGNLLFLSKECHSNGCIATVDISYPSMPLYLLYNPELVKGMMRPILKFARMPVWPFDFAPHDTGTYPFCGGQVYGLNGDKTRYHGNYVKSGEMETNFPLYLLPKEFDAYRFEDQMPVEESANLLVMFLATYERDKDIAFFKENVDLAEKWVEYLVRYGLKPENQLCTDDFAGHLANNVNLAIKATVGIGAYARLIGLCGKSAEEKKYRDIAERFAAEITAFARKFPHLPLTWDSDDKTFSLKYNFAFDKIWGLGLFEQELLEREVDLYIEKCGTYGTPLDSRKEYTKSDWLMWSASLSDDAEKAKKLVAALDRYLQGSESRVPYSDWYDTVTGRSVGFRNRAVQGGCFILLLK